MAPRAAPYQEPADNPAAAYHGLADSPAIQYYEPVDDPAARYYEPADSAGAAPYRGRADDPGAAQYHGPADDPYTAQYHRPAEEPGAAQYHGPFEDPGAAQYHRPAEEPGAARRYGQAGEAASGQYYGGASEAAPAAANGPGGGYGPADEDWDRYTEAPPAYPREAGPSDGYDPAPLDVYDPAPQGDRRPLRDERTATLVNKGRTSAADRQVGRGLKIGAIVVLAAGLVVGVVLLLLPGAGPTWPAGVAKVQAEVTKACQNPDVSSEPGQVNFACAKGTRQILWVFSLLTSGDNPNFADAKNGRVGLEPITPQQGGVVAWSLNLHHPYDPTDPIDSLQVAARAINNIIGGATVTGSYGNPVVQAGLESSPSNCLRYTGSAKVTSHKGFPGLCTRPISSVAGQAALVADVYQKWVVGAAPKAAQNAATLYENSRNPGSPEVQAILRHVPGSGN
jgi:hypothetical protein